MRLQFLSDSKLQNIIKRPPPEHELTLSKKPKWFDNLLGMLQ
jgi:hypothetical protein